MSTPAIEARDVWKKFRRGESHDSLRDLLPALVRRMAARGAAGDELRRDDFWAVRELSFAVRPGEALGIIGPNGAGKSTVLKLLTRILRPTRGEVVVQGRVGALIEIAAGFHPDLTGRENVYLQGAIMGMGRAEISRKFEQIVEFSGIADFIGTPVKRYSSGMNARLGFSIAAHLEPDVLIIDEVLAVGDFAFQDRAFGRILELVARGTPVVVVSHQLERIAALCTHAILLDRGSVAHQGTPAECISAYVLGDSSADVPASGAVRLSSLAVNAASRVQSGGAVRVTVKGSVGGAAPHDDLAVGFRVRALAAGQVVFASDSYRCGACLPAAGGFEIALRLQMNLPAGLYSLETLVWDVRRDQVVAPGPSATVHVEEGTTFWGTVQLNPRMNVRPVMLAAAAGG
jgi:lipopolysaccharide transport system ATP-binding protein